MVIGQYRAMIRSARTGLLRHEHPASRIRARPTARHDQLQLFAALTCAETIAIKTDVFQCGDVSARSELGSNLRFLLAKIGVKRCTTNTVFMVSEKPISITVRKITLHNRRGNCVKASPVVG